MFLVCLVVYLLNKMKKSHYRDKRTLTYSTNRSRVWGILKICAQILAFILDLIMFLLFFMWVSSCAEKITSCVPASVCVPRLKLQRAKYFSKNLPLFWEKHSVGWRFFAASWRQSLFKRTKFVCLWVDEIC